MKLKRNPIVFGISLFSAIATVASLFFAFKFRGDWQQHMEPFGYLMLGAWILLPPVWFWFEWWQWSREMDADERERIKHMHDVSRNIWLALVVILAAIMGVKFPPA